MNEALRLVDGQRGLQLGFCHKRVQEGPCFDHLHDSCLTYTDLQKTPEGPFCLAEAAGENKCRAFSILPEAPFMSP